jgi:hypothetical protein
MLPEDNISPEDKVISLFREGITYYFSGAVLLSQIPQGSESF